MHDINSILPDFRPDIQAKGVRLMHFWGLLERFQISPGQQSPQKGIPKCPEGKRCGDMSSVPDLDRNVSVRGALVFQTADVVIPGEYRKDVAVVRLSPFIGKIQVFSNDCRMA